MAAADGAHAGRTLGPISLLFFRQDGRLMLLRDTAGGPPDDLLRAVGLNRLPTPPATTPAATATP